mmetsp:Transcript_103773/g.289099  ORF Transcript_103773/g.289099 Transcript_103773/m.289099 type:complete len:229 (-) Transcript_103773:74-760(-)
MRFLSWQRRRSPRPSTRRTRRTCAGLRRAGPCRSGGRRWPPRTWPRPRTGPWCTTTWRRRPPQHRVPSGPWRRRASRRRVSRCRASTTGGRGSSSSTPLGSPDLIAASESGLARCTLRHLPRVARHGRRAPWCARRPRQSKSTWRPRRPLRSRRCPRSRPARCPWNQSCRHQAALGPESLSARRPRDPRAVLFPSPPAEVTGATAFEARRPQGGRTARPPGTAHSACS